MKLWNDFLKNPTDGRYGRKNVVIAFCLTMVFVLTIGDMFGTKAPEYMFNGFLTVATLSLGLTVANKSNVFKTPEKKKEDA